MNFEIVQRMHRRRGYLGPITTMKALGPAHVEEPEFQELPTDYEAMKKFPLSITKVEVHASLTRARKVTEVDVTFYVVAPVDQAETLQARFQAWADQKFQTKDTTFLHPILLQKGMYGEEINAEVRARDYPLAWWALKEHIFFSDDESIAKMWLESTEFPTCGYN